MFVGSLCSYEFKTLLNYYLAFVSTYFSTNVKYFQTDFTEGKQYEVKIRLHNRYISVVFFTFLSQQ